MSIYEKDLHFCCLDFKIFEAIGFRKVGGTILVFYPLIVLKVRKKFVQEKQNKVWIVNFHQMQLYF